MPQKNYRGIQDSDFRPFEFPLQLGLIERVYSQLTILDEFAHYQRRYL